MTDNASNIQDTHAELPSYKLEIIDNVNSINNLPSKLNGKDYSEVMMSLITMVKHDLLAETLQSIGYGFNIKNGLLKFNDFDYDKGIGYANYTEKIDIYVDNSKSRRWKAAVKDIHDYLHMYANYGQIVACPLLKGKYIIANEEGFLNACLWRCGAIPLDKGPYQITDFLNNSGDLYNFLINYGFTKNNFSDLNNCNDYSILSSINFVCVYAGKDEYERPSMWAGTYDSIINISPVRLENSSYKVIWSVINDEFDSNGFGGIIGAGTFTNMNESNKMAMCGIISNRMTGAEVEAAGLLSKHDFPYGAGSGIFNIAVINDLEAIINECHQSVPWFNLKISSSWRRENTVSGGISKHCWGVAVDINAGSSANPWFNHKITGSDPGYLDFVKGSKPNWGMKKFSCPGYDKSKCIWSWDHPIVRIFNAHGWGWGGAYGDTMHFSIITYNCGGGLAGK